MVPMKKKNTHKNKNTSRNTKSSTIEQYLREQRWSDLRTYLTTAEATEELHYPDGLMSSPPSSSAGRGRRRRNKKVPRTTTPPLWTAIFHRAPLDILQQLSTILHCAPTVVLLSVDLLHVALEASSSSSSSTSHHQDLRRQYMEEEYYHVIQFLVENCYGAAAAPPFSSSEPWSILQACTWKEAPVQPRYTPLGHAVSNPRVPATVVQYLCRRGPEAIDRECTVLHTNNGHAYHLSPLALAVALPTTSRKTEIVRLLVHGSQYYENDVEMEGERVPFQPVPDPPPVVGVPETNPEHRDTGMEEVQKTRTKEIKETSGALPIVPPLTSDQVDQAIHTAAHNGEWYVVQELAQDVEALPGRSLDANIQHKMETYYATHDKQQRQQEFRYKYFGMYVVQWNI